MKMKMKFDKDSVVKFAAQHIEKIVFVAVVACSAMIVYGAVHQEMYDKTPDDLTKTADNTQEHMGSTKPGSSTLSLLGPKLPKWLSVELFKTKIMWNPPEFQPRPLRGKPPVLAVEELRGSAGRAPFQLLGKAAAGKQVVCGRRWIVVTSLLPIKKQREAFAQIFVNAKEHNPQNDAPHYCHYWVERAEVCGPGSKLVWKYLPGGARHRADLERIFGKGHEVVDKKYLAPGGFGVDPLGARLSEEKPQPDARHNAPRPKSAWSKDPSIAHPPQIPLPRPEVPPEPAEDPAEDIVAVAPENLVDENGLPLDARGGGRAVRVVKKDKEEEPEYWLFRYFDFNVEPGKCYRYRVRLSLKNPNWGVEEQHLEPDVAAEQRRLIAEGKTFQLENLTTGHCEPTDVIHVPEDYELLLGPVAAAVRAWGGPSAEMTVAKWVESCGKVAHHTQRVVRGNVLNYRGRKFPPEEKIKNAKPVVAGGMPIVMAANVPPPQSQTIEVDYVTEAIVLDIAGGGVPRSKRPGVAGRVILLGGDGTLVVHEELQDRPKVAKLRE